MLQPSFERSVEIGNHLDLARNTRRSQVPLPVLLIGAVGRGRFGARSMFPAKQGR